MTMLKFMLEHVQILVFPSIFYYINSFNLLPVPPMYVAGNVFSGHLDTYEAIFMF